MPLSFLGTKTLKKLSNKVNSPLPFVQGYVLFHEKGFQIVIVTDALNTKIAILRKQNNIFQVAKLPLDFEEQHSNYKIHLYFNSNAQPSVILLGNNTPQDM